MAEVKEKDLRKTRFGRMLTRNNKELRDGRALDILEGIELQYKRSIENMEMELKVKRRNREQSLDLSPTKTFQLSMDVQDAAAFVQKDIELGVEIKQLELKLDVAQRQYADIFAEVDDAQPEPASN